MKHTAVTQAIAKFLKTTTLHGFKYLVARYYLDRIGWALCCIASACCAGGLCVVLWDRFQMMPALLQLSDLSDENNFQPIPTVAICQPAIAVAETFLKHLKTNGENTTRIPATFANAIEGKNTEEHQVELLEDLLKRNNVTLSALLTTFTPECSQLTRRCRWRNVNVDCTQLFKKEMTRWGVCCVATPARFLNITIPHIKQLDVVKELDIRLQCHEGSGGDGCWFYTKYIGEEWLVPTRLSPGFNYLGHLTFVLEKDTDSEKLVGGNCVSSKGYSRSQCLLKCTEKKCGCSDPLRKTKQKGHDVVLPMCSLKRLSCLRTFGLKGNSTCSCLPSCIKIITKLVLQPSLLDNDLHPSLDPIYSGINVNNGVVLMLRINMNLSKLFLLRPTETWLTLLSSLGGVFNMFLGVGLFSALEFLFLLFVQLPISIRRLGEISAPTAVSFNRAS